MVKININIIERNITGTASQEEQEILYAWLELSTTNRDTYFRMKNLWDSISIKTYTHEDIRKEWQLLVDRIEKKEIQVSQKTVSARRFSMRSFLRYAAVFILALGLTWTIAYWQQSPKEIVSTVYQQFTVPPGQRTQVVLSDGTKVWLNATTTLKYPVDFGKNSRHVILDGEATFDVTPADMPFTVSADQVTVTVLGTKFNVRGYSNENYIETALVEGTVKMSNAREEVILSPGQVASFLKESEKTIVKEIPEIENKLGWNTNKLIIEGERLADIVKVLERRFDVTITLTDKELNDYRYTGKFVYNENIEQVLQVIAATTAIHYTIDKQQITISKKKGGNVK